MKRTFTAENTLINFSFALISTVLIFYVLYLGRGILMPLAIAIVIWYLIIRIMALFRPLPGTRISLPEWLSLTLALIIGVALLYGFINLITHSINNIIGDAPKYQEKLQQVLNLVNDYTGSKLQFSQLLNKINMPALFSNLALSLTNTASNLVLILVYVLFLLIEYKSFPFKIRAMAKSPEKLSKLQQTLDHISANINTYMKVKTSVSFLTGFTSYLVLLAFGINYAGFWGVLIFLLNYIPTLGSIIAVLITLLAISVQFTSLWTFVLLAVLLTAIQFIVGNLIEPRFMGKNLNLSPLIILISLAFWGAIWGVLGMFLCVPLMTILNIILSQFESTRSLAILFSSNPE